VLEVTVEEVSKYKKMKKMDISKLLTKILTEDVSRTAKGINYNDTYLVLNNAKTSKSDTCASLRSLGGIKQMTPTNPIDGKTPLMSKFTELYNMRPEAVAYSTMKQGDETIIVFGVVDSNTQSGKRGLLAYSVMQGQSPQRMAGGAGTGCAELQRAEDYGKPNLSEYNQDVLQSFLNKYGSMYAEWDKGNAQNFKKVPLRDLRHNGQPLDWDGDPQGFVWQKVEGGSTKFSDNPEVVDKKMKAQGFTDDQTQVEGNEALMELGFYLKDVVRDLASFQIDPSMVTNKPYWPTEDGGVVVDPTPGQCRDFVRLLKACRNKDKSVTSQQCLNGLFQRKLSTIRCNKKGIFKAGGVLGLKDDFESLMSDTGKFGLANLAAGLGKVRMGKITAESTLDLKINKILNEEHKKFSFVKKETPKFDQEIVENLSTQLVLSAYFDLQTSLKKLNKLNENVFGDITGALGSNLGDKFIQGGKEVIAKKVISYLGFDPNTFIGLLIVNLFANLEIRDYAGLLNNCKKYTAVIVKSALEAWLDLAAQKMGGGSMEGFVYSALKNTVTETAANTTIFKKLEKLASSMVCPLIEGISDGIKDGSLSIF
jgi:hypothetical protein